MLKFFIKLAVFLGSVYLLALLLFFKINKVFTTRTIICDKVSWVQGLHNEEYDFGVIGSSRALNVFNNRIVDDSLHTHSVNIATSGGGYAENYINLYTFLKNGNRMKQLLLQVDGYNLYAARAFHRAFNEQYYMPLLGNDTVSAVIKDHVYAYKYWCWKLVPLTRYVEFNFRFSVFKALKGGYDCDGEDYARLNGYEPLKGSAVAVKDSVPPKHQFAFGDREVGYLQKIISLCKNNRINIVFFNAPEYVTQLSTQVNKTAIDKYYAELAEKNNTVYFSNTEFAAINSDPALFKDFTHLNMTGANLYSLALAKKIKF